MDTLEELRRQIDEIQIPPLPTQQEQDQIMSKRKGQAEIDAGRRAIQDRINAYNQAVDRRSTLMTQLSGLEKDARQAAKEDEAKSPEAMRNKALMTIGPSAFGYGAGYGGGALISKSQNAAEANRNVQRQAIADTGPYAARIASAEKSGIIPGSSALMRGLGRFAPFGAGAAFFGGDAGAMQYMMNNADTQGEKDIYGISRNALGGTAAGMAHSGLEAAFNPKTIPDAASLSKILAPDAAPTPIAPPESPPSPAAPAAPAPSFKSGVEARAYAAEKGVKLPSRLSAAEAITRAEQLKAAADVAEQGSRVAKIASKAGKLGVPAAAAALGYDAASSDAEAAGMTPAEAQTRGVIAGGTTGGAAAAGSYGLTKLLEKVPMLGGALSGGATMAFGAPQLATEAYDPPQEEKNRLRNLLARNLPEWARIGAISDAADMSQVPPRNPLRAPMGMGGIPMGQPGY